LLLASPWAVLGRSGPRGAARQLYHRGAWYGLEALEVHGVANQRRVPALAPFDWGTAGVPPSQMKYLTLSYFAGGHAEGG
jgi:hypothetical protein